MKHHEKITGIIILIVGIILIVWPMNTLNTLCTLMGWCLIISGVLEIVLGIAGGKVAGMITGGIISAVIGIIFITCQNFIITFLPTVIGILTAAGGIVMLINTLRLKSTGPVAVMTIIGSIIAIVLGLIIIFYAGMAVKLITVIIGAILVYFGIMRIFGKKKTD